MAARIYIRCFIIITVLFLLASTGYGGDLGRAEKLVSFSELVSHDLSANRCGISLPSDGMYAVAKGALFNNGDVCGKKYVVTCVAAIGESGNCLPGNDISTTVMMIDWFDAADKTLTMVFPQIPYEIIADLNATSITVNFFQVN